MKDPIVVVGIGEMGGVFARGFLRAGHPVYPVTRRMDFAKEAVTVPEPALALVAVAEQDLQRVLAGLPKPWRDRLGLLQNELLPRDWERHEIAYPTVISAWFEKQSGHDPKVLMPSPLHGPQAGLIQAALTAVGIPTRVVRDADDMLAELVLKNLYIFTTNCCGLRTGGTVAALWAKHQELARAVADEVLAVQEWLTGQRFDRQRLMARLATAFAADPNHQCRGRRAAARLSRVLALADEAGLSATHLRALSAEAGA